MTCHHIDWDGLQIKVATPNGQANPIYFCILCDRELPAEEYKETIKTINKHKKNNTLRFYRTPKGKDHPISECVNEKLCPIHGGEVI